LFITSSESSQVNRDGQRRGAIKTFTMYIIS